jgi:hypothetical protein
MADWVLAENVTLRAHHWGGRLYIDASGDKPGPNYQVAVDRDPDSSLDYVVRWLPPAAPDPDVMTEYWVTSSVVDDRRSIMVRTADGITQVQVEGVGAGSPPEGALRETAVGYSDKWDLAEAMRDAIGQLPDSHPGVQDWLYSYTVASIGAEIGGLAGFNRLRVEVGEV